MRLKFVFIGFILSECFLFTFRCISPVSGNSSQTPNAVIGTLFEPGGVTAAKAVNVQIRLKNSLPDIFSIGTPVSSSDPKSTLTNDSGQFCFSSLNAGTYIIEAKSGNNAVLIDSVMIEKDTVVLSPETLKTFGAIKGTIILQGGGDPTNIFVLAFGIGQFARVNIDGSFIFSSLAEGNYDLRLISSLQGYGKLDIKDTKVKSSDTIDLGIIEYPYVGIPVPANVTLTYDTMKQIVTVTWEKINDLNITKYNVYRTKAGSYSDTVQLNKRIVKDNKFQDSTCEQDETFEYSVASVDAKESVGAKSTPMRIKTIGAFDRVDSLEIQGETLMYFDLAFDNNSNLWAADYNKLCKFDPTGIFSAQWAVETGILWGQGSSSIAIDAQNNIFKTTVGGSSILKFDSSGNLVQRMDDTSINIYGISVDGNGYIYCSITKKTDSNNYRDWSQPFINKYNSDLTLNMQWKTASDYSFRGLISKNGKIYFVGTLNYSFAANDFPEDIVIEIFNSDGASMNLIHIRQGSGDSSLIYIEDIAIDKNGLIYCLDGGKEIVRIISETSGYIGKLKVSDCMTDNYKQKASTICIGDDDRIIIGILHETRNISTDLSNRFYVYRKR